MNNKSSFCVSCYSVRLSQVKAAYIHTTTKIRLERSVRIMIAAFENYGFSQKHFQGITFIRSLYFFSESIRLTTYVDFPLLGFTFDHVDYTPSCLSNSKICVARFRTPISTSDLKVPFVMYSNILKNN